MAKRQPLRMCLCCRKMLPKSELLRLADMQGKTVPDLRSRLPGRGRYICADPACLERLRKPKEFRRLLGGTTDERGQKELLDEIDAIFSERRQAADGEARRISRGTRVIHVAADDKSKTADS